MKPTDTLDQLREAIREANGLCKDMARERKLLEQARKDLDDAMREGQLKFRALMRDEALAVRVHIQEQLRKEVDKIAPAVIEVTRRAEATIIAKMDELTDQVFGLDLDNPSMLLTAEQLVQFRQVAERIKEESR